MKTYNIILHALSILIASFVGLFIALVIMFMYPMEIINLKYPIEILNQNKTIKPGEKIYFSIKYDKYKLVPETVYKEVVVNTDKNKDYVLVTNSVEAILPTGKDKNVIMAVEAPIFVTNAKGVVKVVFKYTIYGRTILTDPVESEQFKIIEDSNENKK